MAKSTEHNKTHLKEEYDALVKYYKSEASASKVAWQCLNERYFTAKIKQLSHRIDIEEVWQFQNGRIYTFEYFEPKYKDDRKKLPYYDGRPIVLVINTFKAEGTSNLNMVGINLNLIPRKMRITILDILLNKLNKQYKTTEYDEVLYHGDMYEFLKLVIGKLYSSGFEFAIRSYIFDLIKRPTYINYNDWKYVCLIDSRDFIHISVEEVYSNYWENKKKLNLTTKKK
ncbi:MAG: hypothetical protein FWC41_03460 [Firmicutes bacterium]|nr:hypothetical protein [Bacillota bacterium]